MTTTYLYTAHDLTGTWPVIARTEAEALHIVSRHPGAMIVGTVPPPAPYTPPMYHPELIGQRDPLDTEE